MVALRNTTTGDIIVFDVIDSEGYNYEATITEFPVESLDFVVDHIQRKPYGVQVTAAQTAQPMLYGERPLGSPTLGTDRLREIFQTLVEWQQAAQLVDYVSVDLGVFPNLGIQNLDYSYGAQKTQFLDITVELKEIQTGRTERVELPPIRSPGQKAEVLCGPQPGSDLDYDWQGPPVPTEASTVLFRAVEDFSDKVLGGTFNFERFNKEAPRTGAPR